MKKQVIVLLVCMAGCIMTASAGMRCLETSWQNDPIKKIAKEIAKSNVYVYNSQTEPVSAGADQLLRFRELDQTGVREDLLILAKTNKNAVVRLYAYQVLIKRFKDVPSDLLQQFSNDHSPVDAMRGNVHEKTTVNKIADSFLY